MEEWEVTTDATLEWFIVSECRLRNKGGNIVELTEQQQSVIDSTSRRIVVLSCAGSGKTTVIALRIASLWKKGAKPEEFLALTFSNKAAQEMKKRIYKEDPNLGAKVCVKTFHAFGLEIVKRFNTALGFSGPVTIAKSSEKKSTIDSILKKHHIDGVAGSELEQYIKQWLRVQCYNKIKEDL